MLGKEKDMLRTGLDRRKKGEGGVVPTRREAFAWEFKRGDGKGRGAAVVEGVCLSLSEVAGGIDLGTRSSHQGWGT